MFKYLTSLILFSLAILTLVLFANPLYTEVNKLKSEQADYNSALGNSKSLENERDKLTAEYSTISPENLERLRKMLPDNVDNIRLILEIEKMALPYGMVLRDVKYSATPDGSASDTAQAISSGTSSGTGNQDYGSWDLEFSVTGTYTNFLSFLKDLESNLRIIDVASINFSSATSLTPNKSMPESYTYNFRIKTYWLKN